MDRFFAGKFGRHLACCLAGLLIGLSLGGASTARADCQDLLGNRTYRCDVTSSLGARFSDCFQFRSAGFRSTGFNLLVEGAASVQRCACKIGGTFSRPRFGVSDSFLCVSAASAPFGLALEGDALGRSRITGEGVNDSGVSFAFTCRRVTSCFLPFFTQRSEGGSAWSAGN